MTREDIEFTGPGGATLRGWFYPANTGRPSACVVLQHGFSAVKEMYLDDYAEVFQSAGLSSVVYDHPGQGASDPVPGTPLGELDPWQQVRGIQDAITYAASRPDVDANRIGVWGSSYAAGHAFVVAATDPRVKAVCGQLPGLSGRRAFEDLVPINARSETFELFAQDRASRSQGGDPITVPSVAAEPVGQALPGITGYNFFTTAAAERVPSWRNEVTLRSLELLRGYEPIAYMPLIAPTPLLMIVAPDDEIVASEHALTAYSAAVEPKRLELVPGSHFDAYLGDQFKLTAGSASEFFVTHLNSSTPSS